MIKNIIFDIGNVLVRWDPLTVVKNFFPSSADWEMLTRQLFRSEAWFALNLGTITEAELVQLYHRQLGLDVGLLNDLMQKIKESMSPIPGSFELLENLDQAHFALYALTDNTQDIVSYLQKKYHFWSRFKGIVVSAEVGLMKPSPLIFQYLLNKYQLNSAETLFIDDYARNIEGAKQINLAAIQFENTAQCIEELRRFNISIPKAF